MIQPNMPHLDAHQEDGSRRRKSPPADGNAIPPRSRHRPSQTSPYPPQPTLKAHAIRLMVATAIGFALMLALLWMAIQFLQRDWNRKMSRASSSRSETAAAETLASLEKAPQGWKYELVPSATKRQMDRFASAPLVSDWWLVMARGISDKTDPRLVIACLRMAMAVHGETAEMKNDLGAVYLQQKRMKDAADQFNSALQISPGFTTARFNLALCAVAERKPEQAIRLLGAYLGQRPRDGTALRLQSTLLSQLGRPGEALVMLEKFLKDQPPSQPLFLEAAVLAARLGQDGNALRYLEIALEGNPIQTVVRAYQSPAFREIRLSGQGDPLAARMATEARAAFAAPMPAEEIQPLRAPATKTKPR